MFRLTAFLCIGIFAAMLIGGQDRGQLRLGLMQAKDDKAAQAVEVAAVPPAEDQDSQPQAVATAFVPEKPLMSAPEVGERPAETTTAAPSGRVLYVASDSANVREGPGKDHAVIERLPRGEAVLVLAEGEGAEGWSLIRIEGDGIEGYVAARLLRE